MADSKAQSSHDTQFLRPCFNISFVNFFTYLPQDCQQSVSTCKFGIKISYVRLLCTERGRENREKVLVVKDNKKNLSLNFNESAPMGQFCHRVPMSIYVSVWAIGCSFLQGLSLALRSHDQF